MRVTETSRTKMTTIVLDRKNKCIIADKLETWDGTKIRTDKIARFSFRNTDGGLIACAGSSFDGNKFTNFLSSLTSLEDLYTTTKKKPKLKKMSALIVIGEQTFYIDEGYIPIEITDDYFAIGAGGDPALVLIDAFGPNWETIFTLLADRFDHTSYDFDIVKYGQEETE